MPHSVRSACVPPQRSRSRNTTATIAQAMPGWSLSTGATGGARPSRARSGRPGARRAGDGAVQDHRPADLAEDRGADQPRPVAGVAEAGVVSASTAYAAAEPAHDEHDQPDQHERPADVAQRLAARTAGEVDRERVQPEHEHEQQRAEHAHGLHGGLRGGAAGRSASR